MSSADNATRTKKGHCGHPGCTRALFARGKCYRHDMEDRGLRKKGGEDDDMEESITSPSAAAAAATTPASSASASAPRRQSSNGGSAFKDKNKQPLCICPECDKKLTSMRGLFGHYGVKHRTQVNHDEITYACPFCVVDPNDEEVEFEVFEGVEELVSNILCVLIIMMWCGVIIRLMCVTNKTLVDLMYYYYSTGNSCGKGTQGMLTTIGRYHCQCISLG
jgi:hypothetical protein